MRKKLLAAVLAVAVVLAAGCRKKDTSSGDSLPAFFRSSLKCRRNGFSTHPAFLTVVIIFSPKKFSDSRYDYSIISSQLPDIPGNRHLFSYSAIKKGHRAIARCPGICRSDDSNRQSVV